MATVDDEINHNVAFHADVDMADLPFANDSFDIIVCGFSLMFPPDKARVAREFKRVLRPGGKIYGMVFRSPAPGPLPSCHTLWRLSWV